MGTGGNTKILKTGSVRATTAAARAPVTTAGFDDVLKLVDRDHDGRIGMSYMVAVSKTGQEVIMTPAANYPPGLEHIETRGTDEIEAYLNTYMEFGSAPPSRFPAIIDRVKKDLGISLTMEDLKGLFSGGNDIPPNRRDIMAISLAILIRKKLKPAGYDFISRADWERVAMTPGAVAQK